MSKHKWRKLLFVFPALVMLLCASGVWRLVGNKNDPRISVTYLDAVDGQGHWKLHFAITNIGNTTVFTSRIASIELADQSAFGVGATSPLRQLNPGQGEVVGAVLSDIQMQSLRSKWRYKCHYAQDGVRARIFRWQWGTNGPGPRVNWLIPQKLKGMPLNVEGSTDWIEPLK